MKKILKGISSKMTEKAFTSMSVYQPKLPKALKNKIESKKD